MGSRLLATMIKVLHHKSLMCTAGVHPVDIVRMALRAARLSRQLSQAFAAIANPVDDRWEKARHELRRGRSEIIRPT
jgi:hypothetical protein